MNKKYLFVLSFGLLLSAVFSNAYAQESQETNSPSTDTSATLVEDLTISETSGGNVEEGNNEGLPTLDPDSPLYWAQMRDVYVYQQKAIQKDGRFALDIYVGVIPNNIFERYAAFGFRLDYYLLENLALELASSYDLAINTGLKEFLVSKDKKGGLKARGVLLGDTQISHTNLGVTWSPLYGKSSFYQATINYFDLYLYGGLGLAVVRTQPNFNSPFKYDLKVEGALGAGVNFFLTQNARLRLDYRQFIFRKVGGGVAIPSEISLAFGWMF